MQQGPEGYNFLYANTPCPSIRTLQRDLQKRSKSIEEGIVRVEELKAYIIRNNLPMIVIMSEDATKINGALEYDSTRNKVCGLVAPLDNNGMPQCDLFEITNPRKLIADVHQYPIGRNVVVTMTQPLKQKTAPFCLQYFCTDNKFTSSQVRTRWNSIKTKLLNAGIGVIATSTDGDPRYVTAMMEDMRMPTITDNPYGEYFIASCSAENICVQDPTHTINKFRTRLMRRDKQLIIGKHQITRTHLEDLIRNVSKDKHGLILGDLNEDDKMKFQPVLKIIKPEVLLCMEQSVTSSQATVLYLSLMKFILSAFMDPCISPTEAVFNCWYTLFVIRAWRKWCMNKFKTVKHCITSNTYWCLELNAHSLVKYINICRDENIPYIPTLLHSQTCESFFRAARSFTTTESTVVNFTMKSFQSRLNRIQAKQDIMYSRTEEFSFPRIQQNTNTVNFDMPSTQEIVCTLTKARAYAFDTLISLGIDKLDIEFTDSLSLRHSRTKPTDFEFISLQCSGNSAIERNFEALDINDVEELIPNSGGELNLKNSKCSTRHTFAIRNKKGTVIHVKKSTFLWILSNGTQRCSSDRSYRFRETSAVNEAVVREVNKVFTSIRCGEWIAMKANEEVFIVKIYGFKYLSGDRTSYTLTEAPIHVPTGTTAKGVGVIGNYFTIVCCKKDIVLELDEESNERTLDTKYYISHLEKPETHTYGIFYKLNTSKYIRALLLASANTINKNMI
ncbi:uncharacterized protein LOC131432318 isoform X1 [Malaya genurostris]|uniref:uncharacterized protein LOC131432318 isoform X1 n=2 Tax=Malaya genurostris TaxID=325434 RepID=UPI0026F38315|nr:uncharacterized protein LOC131432318 isoform X1 [Malaya genurostris]